MKIIVAGGTGMVGREVVTEARNRGHEVLVGSTRPGADVVVDADDTAGLLAAAADVDAVVVSVPPSRGGKDPRTWVESMQRLARSTSPARFVLLGGAGSSLADGKRLVDGPDFPAFLKDEALAAADVLDEFRSPTTTLDWTIVTPAPMLEPGERTGSYRTSDDDAIGTTLSTQDLAVAIVDELETPKYQGKRVVIG